MKRSTRGQAAMPAIFAGLGLAVLATFTSAWMGGHVAQWVAMYARLSAALVGG